ncbi:MAG: hypothetical protein KBB83_00375 [Alphaproteobacteria bacterium]|nr:hypothetical protein [Alphaproteobacteria bacterium]
MVREIKTHEYKAIRDNNTPHILLDVRQPWEVKKACIQNSINIPLTDLIHSTDELDKNKKIIVYCHHGIRSLNACFFLRELGFQDVLSLSGGIEEWSIKIDPGIPQY